MIDRDDEAERRGSPMETEDAEPVGGHYEMRVHPESGVLVSVRVPDTVSLLNLLMAYGLSVTYNSLVKREGSYQHHCYQSMFYVDLWKASKQC